MNVLPFYAKTVEYYLSQKIALFFEIEKENECSIAKRNVSGIKGIINLNKNISVWHIYIASNKLKNFVDSLRLRKTTSTYVENYRALQSTAIVITLVLPSVCKYNNGRTMSLI